MIIKEMSKLSYWFAFLVLIYSCKLVEQPKISQTEYALIKRIESRYECQVNRYYSQSFLRYHQQGDYTVKITFNDSLMRMKLDSNARTWAYYIDSAVLKDNSLIKEISFHLINPRGNGSYEVVSYLTFSRDSLSHSIK